MSTYLACLECGHKFCRTLKSATQEVKCPKCGGYDVDLASVKDLLDWANSKEL